MKLIVATVPTDRLRQIQEELRGPDATVLYVSGVGDLRETLVGAYRGATYIEPRPRTRLEIVVMNDLAVPDVMDCLKNAACGPAPTTPTQGSIFVLPLEDYVVISANGRRFE